MSGTGTNLHALLHADKSGDLAAEVVLVLSNRAGAAALDVAARHGVSAWALPVSKFDGDQLARDRTLKENFIEAGVDVVVLAGYDRILSPEFLEAFPDAIINIHPSLLPAFGGGMRAVEDALEHGVKVAGCTIQLTEPGAADGGPIILQAAVPVLEDDDTESLRARIHGEEWKLLPEAVALWATGRLRRDGRRIRILGGDRAGRAGITVVATQDV